MQRTFRATPSSYLILVGLLSVPTILWVVARFWRRQLNLEALAVTLALPLAFAIWLASFRLIISDNRITYRSLFGGVESASFDEIESIGAARVAPVSSAPLGVKVKLREGNGFVINTKPFPIEAVRLLFNAKGTNKPLQATALNNAARER
jgi:hypothetical protein